MILDLSLLRKLTTLAGSAKLATITIDKRGYTLRYSVQRYQDVTAHVPTDVDMPHGVHLCLAVSDLKPLGKALDGKKDCSFTFVSGHYETLTFSLDNGSATIKPIKSTPEEDTPVEMTEVLSMPSGRFAKICKEHLPFIEEKDTRYYATVMGIIPTEDGVDFSSSDGATMRLESIKEHKIKATQGVNIPYAAMKIFAAMGDAVCEDVTVCIGGDKVSLRTDSLTITTKAVHDKYPPLNIFKYFAPCTRIAIDNKEWLKFLKGKKGNVKVTSYMNRIDLECGAMTTAFKKMEMNSADLNASYDAKMLAMLVKDCDAIYLDSDSPSSKNRPIRTVKDNVILAIVPIHVGGSNE